MMRNKSVSHNIIIILFFAEILETVPHEIAEKRILNESYCTENDVKDCKRSIPVNRFTEESKWKGDQLKLKFICTNYPLIRIRCWYFYMVTYINLDQVL